MKLVIVAGGQGKRLNLKRIPKPMTKVGGKPVLQHQIELARKYGIEEIFILSGHLANVISKYFSDGKKFGVKIEHLIESHPLGTAGCLKQLEKYLSKDENFLLFSGDIFINMDISRLISFAKRNDALVTLVVRPTNHPHDSDLVEIGDGNRIVAYHTCPHSGDYPNNCLGISSIGILNRKVLDYIPEGVSTDLWKRVLPEVLNNGHVLVAYRSHEYIRDIGTPKRLRKVRRDYEKNQKGPR